MNKQLSSNQKVKCILCHHVYKNKEVIDHMHGLAHQYAFKNIPEWKNPYQCVACSMSFVTYEDYRVHARTARHKDSLLLLKRHDQGDQQQKYISLELIQACQKRDSLQKQKKFQKFEQKKNEKIAKQLGKKRKLNTANGQTCGVGKLPSLLTLQASGTQPLDGHEGTWSQATPFVGRDASVNVSSDGSFHFSCALQVHSNVGIPSDAPERHDVSQHVLQTSSPPAIQTKPHFRTSAPDKKMSTVNIEQPEGRVLQKSRAALEKNTTVQDLLKRQRGTKSEPNLTTARRVRSINSSQNVEGLGVKERMLKPTLQKLISSTSAERKVNWKELYQEYHQRRLKDMGKARFGIEMVNQAGPLLDLPSVDEAQDQAEPPPPSSLSYAGPYEQHPVESCMEYKDLQTAQRVSIKTEQSTWADWERSEAETTVKQNVRMETPSFEPQDISRKKKLPRMEKGGVDELLAVSMREEELSSTLDNVDSSLFQAQSTLQAAYMDVQRLLLAKEEMTAQINEFRAQRIKILKELQGSSSSSSEKEDGTSFSSPFSY
ncbi:zinc finger protein 106 isoform X2 [Denticeps clupeoides]|uniref:zinc finger protein 106 isoform X2 n=1 Tax=Denticeps clupeoides TaxID=299321 RepID=UPI0010A2C5E4|nr:zinc finger protein 106-like isoform X2 [Denticeps clupeoides]